MPADICHSRLTRQNMLVRFFSAALQQVSLAISRASRSPGMPTTEYSLSVLDRIRADSAGTVGSVDGRRSGCPFGSLWGGLSTCVTCYESTQACRAVKSQSPN